MSSIRWSKILATAAALTLGVSSLSQAAIFQGVSNNYIAAEAEVATITAGGAGSWIVVEQGTTVGGNSNPVLPAGNNASGGKAVLADFGTSFTSPPSTLTYNVNFDSAGTYRLYLRESMFESGTVIGTYGNEDSAIVPADGANITAAPTATRTGVPAAAKEGKYVWSNTGFDYTVTAAQVGKDVSFKINTRENGYSIDRLVLSKTTNLSTADNGALDQLANSQQVNNLSGAFLYYSYELPDTSGDGKVTDNSGHGRDGTLSTLGNGSYNYSSNAAPGSKQSLELNDAGARLTRTITTSELNFSSNPWTFATWFYREDNATDDMIFHIGAGDGFGAENELYIRSSAGGLNAIVEHYKGAEVVNRDVQIVKNGVSTDAWHHVALVFNGSVLSFYVDGAFAGSDSSFNFAMSQSAAVAFGGHAGTTRPERFLNGGLDETAIWKRALDQSDIALLASGANPLTIPEPATAGLAMLSLGALAFRRRR